MKTPLSAVLKGRKRERRKRRTEDGDEGGTPEFLYLVLMIIASVLFLFVFDQIFGSFNTKTTRTASIEQMGSTSVELAPLSSITNSGWGNLKAF